MFEKYDHIRAVVQAELDGAAHHIDHIMRVVGNASLLAEGETDIDLEVLTLAALLHDIARKKEDADATGLIDHAVVGADMAKIILTQLGFTKDQINKIVHCIITHRFRNQEHRPATKEAQILFDADKLDLTGAVGIARMFMIAGQFKQSIIARTDVDSYCRKNLRDGRSDGRIIDMSEHSPVIEFETKIKLLAGRLYTERGRQLAHERIAFMQDFFSRLAIEITDKSKNV